MPIARLSRNAVSQRPGPSRISVSRWTKKWPGRRPGPDEARPKGGERLAEREGFEPPCRLPGKTLSRRPRYDHFGTSPYFTSLGGASLNSPPRCALAAALQAPTLRVGVPCGYPPALACGCPSLGGAALNAPPSAFAR